MRLEGVQRKLADGGRWHLLKLEAKLRVTLNEMLDQLETFWFQKSRVDAIRDGDRNTRYFHLSAIIKRRRNKIEALQNAEGVWESNPEVVKSMVLNYYTSLFTDSSHSVIQSNLPSNCFPLLKNAQVSAFAKDFTAKEVKDALFSMKPFKASGPDGY